MTDLSRHLTDDEIVARLDEPDLAPVERFDAHVAACEACRARLAATMELFAALRADPPAAGEAELADRRDRILAAVAARSRRAERRFPGWAVWTPLAAAAVIAALVVWAPRGLRSPENPVRITAYAGRSGSSPSELGEDAARPVVVEASRAAEEVLQAAGLEDTGGLVDAPPIDAGIPDGSLVIADYEDPIQLEEAFADLPSEDREAILDELASISFEP